jgi:hypothetical protein
VRRHRLPWPRQRTQTPGAAEEFRARLRRCRVAYHPQLVAVGQIRRRVRCQLADLPPAQAPHAIRGEAMSQNSATSPALHCTVGSQTMSLVDPLQTFAAELHFGKRRQKREFWCQHRLRPYCGLQTGRILNAPARCCSNACSVRRSTRSGASPISALSSGRKHRDTSGYRHDENFATWSRRKSLK